LSAKLDEEKMLEDKFNNSKREMRDNNKVLKKQVTDLFQVKKTLFWRARANK